MKTSWKKAACSVALAVPTLMAFTSCRPIDNRGTGLSAFATAGSANVKTADCVMYRESRYQPDVTGHNRNGTYDSGMFQINSIHAALFTKVTGQPWSHRYSPYWNARYARYLFDIAGWAPWGGGCTAVVPPTSSKVPSR